MKVKEKKIEAQQRDDKKQAARRGDTWQKKQTNVCVGLLTTVHIRKRCCLAVFMEQLVHK